MKLPISFLALMHLFSYVTASICDWHSHQPFMNAFEYQENTVEADRVNLSFRCPVCGKRVKAESWPSNHTLRESGRCSACKATNRQRQLAYAVNRFMSGRLRMRVDKLGDACQPGISILNLESSGPLHDSLSSGNCKYTSSEYFGPEVTTGTFVNGTRNEDVQRLSFQADTFDLVMSTEVFEHVPNPYAGHSEIYRVLKPGGAHIFTVPFMPSKFHDKIYASIDSTGKIIHHLPPTYHLDRLRPDGVLVYSIFGQSMVDKLCALGFEMDVMYLQVPSAGIIGSGAIVFVARKPI